MKWKRSWNYFYLTTVETLGGKLCCIVVETIWCRIIPVISKCHILNWFTKIVYGVYFGENLNFWSDANSCARRITGFSICEYLTSEQLLTSEIVFNINACYSNDMSMMFASRRVSTAKRPLKQSSEINKRDMSTREKVIR